MAVLNNGAFTRTNGAASSQNYPRFHMESVQDEAASEREGRPIFRDEERVEIIMPGNPHTRPIARVTAEHKQQWPDEYAKFKSGQDMALTGTPLEQWPMLKKSQVMELKSLGFITVEQVGTMDDLAMQRFMGGRRMRDLARAFLDDAEAGKQLAQATADNDRKDAELAQLRQQVEQMRSMVDSMHGELQGLKNAPSPIATHIPGLLDPMEQLRQGHAPAPAVHSALESLPEPRRRGRKEEATA